MIRRLVTSTNSQQLWRRPLFPTKNIYLSTTTMDSQASATEVEINLRKKLVSSFPQASCIQIEDVSGGCGAMYQIYVESPEFKGMSKVKQHQLINTVLKDEIRSMHGIRINTGVPKE